MCNVCDKESSPRCGPVPQVSRVEIKYRVAAVEETGMGFTLQRKV